MSQKYFMASEKPISHSVVYFPKLNSKGTGNFHHVLAHILQAKINSTTY